MAEQDGVTCRMPFEDREPSSWSDAELRAFMRANAPEGVDVDAMLPVVRSAIGQGADPRALAPMMRGAAASGADPERMLAMMQMGGASPQPANVGERPQGKAEPVSAAGRVRTWFSPERGKKALVILMWLAVWELADHLVDNRLVLTGPVRTLQALTEQIVKADFWLICAASFCRIAAGFILAFAGGILIAVAAHRVRLVRDLIEPIVGLLKTVPMVSFIIMLLIWVGNQALTIYLSFLIVMPLVYTNMYAGLEAVDPKMLEMACMCGMGRWRQFLYIYRPAFMPFLVSGCKVSLGMSWKSGIMAEVFGTPAPSIGKQMFAARTFLDTPSLFAWTAVVMLLSVVFEKAFMALLSRAARPLGERLGTDGVDLEAGRLGEPAEPVETVAATSIEKSYGNNHVLSGLNLTLEPAGRYCLMAPSGYGKTTLLRILLGLEPADDGKVDGLRTGEVSVTFQEDRLCDRLSAIENVVLAHPNVGLSRERVREMLAEVLPADCLDQPVSELSGGMRRRVSLVRAMAFPGAAIVMDEPFTGLDAATRAEVIAFILRHQEGRTLLVSTHGERDAEMLGAQRIDLAALRAND